MTRHFSQFLFAPYGDGEGLRAVDARPADERLLGSGTPLGTGRRDEEGAGSAAAVADGADEADGADWPALTAVEWPLTHRPFDDDGPVLAEGRFAAAAADEDPDGEAQEEAAAHAARAALLAEVYGWPHRAV